MSWKVRRFQLAVAVILVAVFAVPIVWLIVDWSHVQREREVALAVEQLGGRVAWAGDGIGFRWPCGGRIVFVYVMDTNATDDDFGMLASLQRPRGVYARNTAITDDGIEHLLSMRELERLDIEETAITDRGLMCLRGLKSSGGRVELCGTLVTDRGLAEFRKQAPNWRASR